MKRLLFLILLLANVGIYCQNTEKTNGLVSLGFFFSPNYSYRHLEYDDSMINIVEAREFYEKPAFGFNTGLRIFFNVTPWLEIESGSQLYQQTHKLKDVPIMFYDSIMGYSTGKYEYNYICLPLKLNFYYKNKKFYIGASIGCMLDFYINARLKSRVEYNDGVKEIIISDINYLDPYKTAFNVMGSVFTGYDFNNKWSIRLEPIFRYSLTPIEDAPIQQYNYSLGGQLGIIYNFNKKSE